MQGVGGILQQKLLLHTSNLSGFDVCHAQGMTKCTKDKASFTLIEERVSQLNKQSLSFNSEFNLFSTTF